MLDKKELQDLEEKVSLGLKRAFQKMLEFKKQKKSKVIVSRDGKVMALDPDEIVS